MVALLKVVLTTVVKIWQLYLLTRIGEQIRGAKIATIFQDPMTSLDPIKTIGSQITEVIVKHQGKTAKEAKRIGHWLHE